MTDVTGFRDALSPYMDLVEDALGINADNLGPIIPFTESPVLVAGAGQGLLVEALRQRGFRAEGIDLSRQMVVRAGGSGWLSPKPNSCLLETPDSKPPS